MDRRELRQGTVSTAACFKDIVRMNVDETDEQRKNRMDWRGPR